VNGSGGGGGGWTDVTGRGVGVVWSKREKGGYEGSAEMLETKGGSRVEK